MTSSYPPGCGSTSDRALGDAADEVALEDQVEQHDRADDDAGPLLLAQRGLPPGRTIHSPYAIEFPQRLSGRGSLLRKTELGRVGLVRVGVAFVDSPGGATAGHSHHRQGAVCRTVGELDPMSQAKLVRDKIPQIIRAAGTEPVIRVASAEEYRSLLRAKLVEEVEEFLASDDPTELADVLEVLLALAGELGVDRNQLEKLRSVKASQRGGFADRIVWSGNAPDQR